MYGSSVASALVAGAAADIAAQHNPNNRADVENIRAALLGAGNYNWEDLVPSLDPSAGLVSPDGYKEPLLSLDGIPSVPPPLPTVSSLSIVKLKEDLVVLQGSVDPEGPAGRYRFECGPGSDSNYAAYEEVYIPAGNNPVPVSETIAGLEPDSPYHCRLSAHTVAQQVYGPGLYFSTAPESKPTPFLLGNQLHAFTHNQAAEQADFARFSNGAWQVYNESAEVSGRPLVTGTPAVLKTSSGELFIFSRTTAGKLLAFYKAPSGGAWTGFSLSAVASDNPNVLGSPCAVERGPNEISVFIRNDRNELISFDRSAAKVWTATNESSGGQRMIGNPSAVVLDPNLYSGTTMAVYARDPENKLVSFNRLTNGAWVSRDESAASGEFRIRGNPTALTLDPNLYSGTNLVVFARGEIGHLVSFNRLTNGAWLARDETNATGGAGGTEIRGTPTAVKLNPSLYAETNLAVFARSSDNRLVSFNRITNGAWAYRDESAASGGARILASPSAIVLNPAEFFNTGLSVFARNTNNELISIDRLMTGAWVTNNMTTATGIKIE